MSNIYAFSSNARIYISSTRLYGCYDFIIDWVLNKQCFATLLPRQRARTVVPNLNSATRSPACWLLQRRHNKIVFRWVEKRVFEFDVFNSLSRVCRSFDLKTSPFVQFAVLLVRAARTLSTAIVSTFRRLIVQKWAGWFAVVVEWRRNRKTKKLYLSTSFISETRKIISYRFFFHKFVCLWRWGERKWAAEETLKSFLRTQRNFIESTTAQIKTKETRTFFFNISNLITTPNLAQIWCEN